MKRSKKIGPTYLYDSWCDWCHGYDVTLWPLRHCPHCDRPITRWRRYPSEAKRPGRWLTERPITR